MAKTDPAGEDYKAEAYVFGELGQQVKNVKRAWETCVLKSQGHEPTWQTTAHVSCITSGVEEHQPALPRLAA